MAHTFESYLKLLLPKIPMASAQAVLELHKEGATVPFIARYRKEKTKNLDEVAIRDVIEAHEDFTEVINRQAFILKELEAQGNLTPELKGRVVASIDIGELEELYRPYKRKRKTKAKIAREAGIEPFAQWLWSLGQGESEDSTDIVVKAKEYLNAKAQFATYQEVIKGAQDILIEKLSNNQDLRKFVREHLLTEGKIVSKKGKKIKPKSKYEMYVNFEEKIKNLMGPKTSYRYMAMKRGWAESQLTLSIEGDQELLLQKFSQECIKKDSHVNAVLQELAKSALTLHVMPSISNEIHKKLKDIADGHAIEVFASNVQKVLLSSPLGPKCVLGLDPGLKTGAKVALIDQGGNFVTSTVLKILGDKAEIEAEKLFKELFEKIKIEAIAIGNGTGGRETEKFLRKLFKKLEVNVPIVMVNEAGASVYSASDVAREEFPNLDLTIRGAISIARRLQDPLSELVKVDPQSIGVGQYQHDVSPTRLKKSLGGVVESCVNNVGIDLNTASPYLLQYISGIGPATAKNIVEFRKEKGLFKKRDQLNQVPNFSSKVFELSAGFLRVANGENFLDQTGIHPERYGAVSDMAKDINVKVSELRGENINKLTDLKSKYAELIGEYTFDDIIKELKSPGRDPRDAFKAFSFRDDIFEVKDLKEDMICPGIVTNVTNFGAFVDVGVHQDGLVHISELTHDFVDDPAKFVAPGDQVEVKVMKIDAEKNQVFLTMKLQPAPKKAPRPKKKDDSPRKIHKGKAKAKDDSPRKMYNRKPKDDSPRKMYNRKSKDDRGKGNKGKDNRGRDNKPFKRKEVALNTPFADLAAMLNKKD